jgi:hypothetical protein
MRNKEVTGLLLHYALPERQFLFTSRRGAISQEVGIFFCIILESEVSSSEMYRADVAWTRKTILVVLKTMELR